MHMSNQIGIIDVFAGPGGLGEGFSGFEASPGHRPFRIGVSAEMERTAHATLRLRAFLRLLRKYGDPMPKAYSEYLTAVAHGRALPPEEHFGKGSLGSLWKEAADEALNLTLGVTGDNDLLYKRIADAKRKYGALVLIGGPPCQAYSLVGRARQTNVPGFHTKGDKKHFLYLEYLQILARFSPDVFIMENVKGILTSSVGGRNMFDRIRHDLAHPGRATGIPSKDGSSQEYVLLPIHVPVGKERNPNDVEHDPSGFLIRCEHHGIPQARHRIIVMGVRSSLLSKAQRAPTLEATSEISIADALAGLPNLRSGVSRTTDDGKQWAREAEEQRKHVIHSLGKTRLEVRDLLDQIAFNPSLSRKATKYNGKKTAFSLKLQSKEQELVTSHETRGHMRSDLGRYLFVAAFGAKNQRSPSSSEFPRALAPNHANWSSGDFADRFRVQVKKSAANTVTSHLSKDGHAFIHWDPRQCRSLTVREAARIQTFPDDYIFLGNRTQQFVQVGNAVPPLLARQIASVVWSILGS